MAKSVAPGTVVLDHGEFRANAVPDVFDARDLEYRSRLQSLPREVQRRPDDRTVTTQVGNSCTGHAVASVANAALAAQQDPTRVSPYMAYALARRYDDYQGDADVGSSLRGALKGWYYHGLLPETEWPDLEMSPVPDVEGDPRLTALAGQRPLGAFYRVNAARLDDLQSAICEVAAVAVAASIHDGWSVPAVLSRPTAQGEEQMHVILRTSASRALGGHAFCLVGYNDVGFLVQNSWGPEWGAGGFATLPYDDWLDSGYDAWAARPGVPSIISERIRRKVFALAGGGLVDAPAPDLAELTPHVVNLDVGGRLTSAGRFVSSPTQLDQVIAQMRTSHERWSGGPRRVLLSARGGLNSEKTTLDAAQRQLNWWLANHVYPITFAWQTELSETLADQLTDLLGAQIPADGAPYTMYEQVDRMVERTARLHLRWAWEEMKDQAEQACRPIGEAPGMEPPGGSLMVEKLRAYLDTCEADTEVHLLGHSAGAWFLTGLLDRLVEARIPVASLTYLGAAVRTDTWMERVLPHLRDDAVGSFVSFGMDPVRELDDVCGGRGVAVYHKSLLYLVSRALERPLEPRLTSAGAPGLAEVPLVGMAHFAGQPVGGHTFESAVEEVGGSVVWAPASDTPDSRSDVIAHDAFDDDGATMTSVLLRMLRRTDLETRNEYRPNLPPPPDTAVIETHPTNLEDQPPDIVTTEVHGEPSRAGDSAPSPATATRSSAPRAAGQDRGRVLPALEQRGWSLRQEPR